MLSDSDKENRGLPEQNNYEIAISAGWNALLQQDWRRQTQLAGAELTIRDSREIILVPLLGRSAELDVESRRLCWKRGEPLKTSEAIPCLHYLVRAENAQPTGNWLAFQEFDGGMFYYPTFAGRAIQPLLSAFGDKPDRLRDAAYSLAGQDIGYGDVGISIPVFPKLIFAVTLFKGDDELPPSANILFDSLVRDWMPTEDVTVLASLLVSMLKKAGGK